MTLLAVAGWLSFAAAAVCCHVAIRNADDAIRIAEDTQKQLDMALQWIERTTPLVAESLRREG